MIKLKNISRTINNIPILHNISLEIKAGEFIAFLGPNGCGKSTLMNILAGVIKQDAGEIIIADAASQKIGFVFQDYRRYLLPYRSVRANILYPLQLRKISAAEQQVQLDKIIDLIGGINFSLDQKIHTLSGGQAQLVSLMRALIIDPAILILDEPFSALDYQATLNLQDTILEVVERLNLTTLLISHNIEEAILMADRLVILSPKPGSVREILEIDMDRPRSHVQIGSLAFSQLQARAISIFLKG